MLETVAVPGGIGVVGSLMGRVLEEKSIIGAVPAGDTEYREWLIDGVAVRVVAYPPVNLTEAKARLASWLPELRRRFGPSPARHRRSRFPRKTS
jgi:hypothetical protein